MRTATGWPVVTLVFALAAGSGCGKDDSSSKAGGDVPASDDGFVGVDPLIFKCDSITPLDTVERAVGGKVEAMETQFRPPKGMAAPCSYMLIEPRALPVPDGGAPPGDGGPAMAQWMWDITYDCREDFHKTTSAEMERLMREEGATRVDIGTWGVEAKSAAIMFFDDDSPCWVRVVGPGNAERRALAELVRDRLNAKNAPMKPRPR